jgi:hypothetical protein
LPIELDELRNEHLRDAVSLDDAEDYVEADLASHRSSAHDATGSTLAKRIDRLTQNRWPTAALY